MTISTGTMPPALAALYQELWPEVVWLASAWQEFKDLYGDQANIDLLNDTAPAFFGDLQRSQQQGVMMHLCRVTDPPVSAGKPTLTLRRVAPLIDNAALAAKVEGFVTAAVNATAFAREWRNRQGAHCELPPSITGQPAAPFPRAAWRDFEGAIASITAVMDAVSLHYCDSTTGFHLGTATLGGVSSLLYFLKMGSEADKQQRDRLGG
jgi:hypothetical protein